MKLPYKVLFLVIFFANAVFICIRALGVDDYKLVATVALRFAMASALLIMVSHPKVGVNERTVPPVCLLITLLYLSSDMVRLH